MGTFFNKDQFICYVGFAADCAIPFGGFVLQAERGLSNLVDEALCNNFKIEYNSAEGPPDGCSMAVDAAGFFAKASNFLKISSNVFTGFGIFDVAKGVVSDAKIQHFLRITNPLLLKGATSKADAIKFAKQFADGVKAYYDKNLSAKGVSEQDWVNAVYDNIHGNKNTLYSSVMEGNK